MFVSSLEQCLTYKSICELSLQSYFWQSCHTVSRLKTTAIYIQTTKRQCPFSLIYVCEQFVLCVYLNINEGLYSY